MGLTAALRRWTPLRPLIVTAPGGEPARMAVERWCDRHAWSPAYAPAQANALVVCGPGSATLDAAVAEVWHQLPLPRRRVTVRAADDADAALRHALAALRSPSYRPDDAAEPAGHGTGGPRYPEPDQPAPDLPAQGGPGGHDGPGEPGGHREHGEPSGYDVHGHEHGGHDDRAHEHSEHEHRPHEAGHEHSGHEDGGHEDGGHSEGSGHEDGRHGGHGGHGGHSEDGGHGHGGHGHGHGGMVLPGGVAMADRGADRDGLMLDRLHVTLGPALYPWPAGLTVRLVLQGDVVQEAAAELLPAGPRHSVVPAVRLLDQAHCLLVLAGWPGAARDARRLRDAVRAGAAPTGYRRWATRVRRSRMLRWSLSGLGPLPGGGPGTPTGAGSSAGARARTGAVPPTGAGPANDVYGRLSAWLDGLDAVFSGRAIELVEPDPGLLPAALAGGDLAAARLVVASLGAAPAREPVPERA
jgi:hypothetical protein